jgi:hypothetical protein
MPITEGGSTIYATFISEQFCYGFDEYDNNISFGKGRKCSPGFKWHFVGSNQYYKYQLSTVSEWGLLGITVSNTTNDGQGFNHILC